MLLSRPVDLGGAEDRALLATRAPGFRVLGDPPRYLRSVVVWQVADWTLRLATVYWFLRAFGLPATLHNALLVQVSQSLSTVFPFSPAGIGTEQALILYVLRGKATRTALLRFSVGMRLTLIVVNVVVGFTAIVLTMRTLRWRRRSRRSRTTPLARRDSRRKRPSSPGRPRGRQSFAGRARGTSVLVQVIHDAEQ